MKFENFEHLDPDAPFKIEVDSVNYDKKKVTVTFSLKQEGEGEVVLILWTVRGRK